MKKRTESKEVDLSGVGLTDADIYEAMKSISGYIDITPGDFKELYCIAYRHAMERFARSVSARDIMATKVVSVQPENPLADVVEVMSEHGVSGVPVLDSEGKVLGVISEKDILFQFLGEKTGNFMAALQRCLHAGGCMAVPVRKLKAGEVMTSPAVTVSEDAFLGEIVELLTQKGINRLPVTDPDGRLAGIIARSDIVNATMRGRTCSWNT